MSRAMRTMPKPGIRITSMTKSHKVLPTTITTPTHRAHRKAFCCRVIKLLECERSESNLGERERKHIL